MPETQSREYQFSQFIDLAMARAVIREIQQFRPGYGVYRSGTLFLTPQIRAIYAYSKLSGMPIMKLLKTHVNSAAYGFIISNLKKADVSEIEDRINRLTHLLGLPISISTPHTYSYDQDKIEFPAMDIETSQSVKAGVIIHSPEGIIHTSRYKQHDNRYYIFDSCNHFRSTPVTCILTSQGENCSRTFVLHSDIALNILWLDVLTNNPEIIQNPVQAEAVAAYRKIRRWTFRKTLTNVLAELLSEYHTALMQFSGTDNEEPQGLFCGFRSFSVYGYESPGPQVSLQQELKAALQTLDFIERLPVKERGFYRMVYHAYLSLHYYHYPEYAGYEGIIIGYMKNQVGRDEIDSIIAIRSLYPDHIKTTLLNLVCRIDPKLKANC